MAARRREVERGREVYELGPKFRFVERMRLPYRIAYVKQMGDVVVHELVSGRRKIVCTDRERHIACPLVWSPDGSTIYHSHEQLLAIDVRSRRVRELTSFRDGNRFAVTWVLQCSPDGSRLVFLHHSRNGERLKWSIFSVGSDGTQLRQISALENVWTFKCDWRRNEIVAKTALGDPSVVRINIDDGGSRTVSKRDLGFNFQLTPDGQRVVYEHQGTIWFASIDGQRKPKALARGRVPSLSPDGSTIAFMGGDDDVYLQRLKGGPAKLVLRARVRPSDDPRRRGSYSKAPLWSPDGKLLFVQSTIGTRSDEPRDPEWVKSLRRRQAVYERARAKRAASGAAPSKKPFNDFEGSIEHAHWQFEHSAGIVDLAARTVWLTQGYWQETAWAPMPDAKQRRRSARR